MKKLLMILPLLIALGMIGCKNSKEETQDTSEDKIEKFNSVSLEMVWSTDTTLMTAESVIFDQELGIYLVSCIGNVPPTAKDGDGFIASIDQRGNVINAKLVTGLSAPKGMGIDGNKLYVTDIDRLVILDKSSGEMLNEIAVDGAQFLNDIDVAPDGTVYFSDSKTNKIHVYDGSSVSLFTDDAKLGGPNGVFVDKDNLVVASNGNGTYKTIDRRSKEITDRGDGIGGGDGVGSYKDGYIISDWNGRIFYMDSNWDKTQILDLKKDGKNTADIFVHADKDLVLVPTFFGNSVEAYKIKM